MITPLVLSFVGTDRPGLTREISNIIAEHNGNWMESQLAQLSGKYAGILLVNVPSANTLALTEALQQLENSDLNWVIERADANALAQPDLRYMRIELIGNDRPGIVRDVTDALQTLALNVEELSSECCDAPMSSETLFKARIRVSSSSDIHADNIQDTLESLADELMIEIHENS